MATRIYLPSSGTPAVTPSTWNHANQAGTTYTLPGVLAKGTTALTSRTTATGTTSPYTRGVMRYVIGPLTATEISGTVNAVLRCSESNNAANATMSIAVKIIQPDGTDRAVLLAATASDSAASPREFTTTLGTRRAFNAAETSPIPLTAQTPTTGDYLVIELGFRSASTTTYNVVMQHGDDSTSDLPYADGNTSAYAPWVEFSGDLVFNVLTVTTSAASSITGTAATGNGNVTNDGGETVTKRGFVWDTSSKAAPGNVAPGSSGYASSVEETGSFSTGAFTGSLTSLSPGTPYFVRAYAYTASGYDYGDEVSFTTLDYIQLSPSDDIAASASTSTTARLTAPSGKTTGDFQAGRISDDTNPLPSIDLDSGKYTELEWCFKVGSDAGASDEYEFRVTSAGTVLETYTQAPKVTVASGGLSLAVPLLASATTIYAPSITAGAVALSPGLLTNTSTLYAPSVISEQQLSAPLLTNNSSMYGPTLYPGSVNLSAPLLSDPDNLFAPSVAPGSVTLSPQLVTNTSSLYAATMTGSVTITAPLLTTTSTLYTPTASPGPVLLVPPLIAATTQLYNPSVADGGAFVVPLLTTTSSLYSPTVAPGAISVAAPLLANSNSLYGPSLVGSVTLSAPLLTNTSTLYSASVAGGAVALSVPLLTGTCELYAPAVTAGAISLAVPLLVNAGELFAPTVEVSTPNLDVPLLGNNAILFAPMIMGGMDTRVVGLTVGCLSGGMAIECSTGAISLITTTGGINLDVSPQ